MTVEVLLAWHAQLILGYDRVVLCFLKGLTLWLIFLFQSIFYLFNWTDPASFSQAPISILCDSLLSGQSLVLWWNYLSIRFFLSSRLLVHLVCLECYDELCHLLSHPQTLTSLHHFNQYLKFPPLFLFQQYPSPCSLLDKPLAYHQAPMSFTISQLSRLKCWLELLLRGFNPCSWSTGTLESEWPLGSKSSLCSEAGLSSSGCSSCSRVFTKENNGSGTYLNLNVKSSWRSDLGAAIAHYEFLLINICII